MNECKIPGGGLRVAGLVLGLAALVTALTGLVLAACGMGQARVCRHCKKGAEFL
jgi:hypothetical protein